MLKCSSLLFIRSLDSTTDTGSDSKSYSSSKDGDLDVQAKDKKRKVPTQKSGTFPS